MPPEPEHRDSCVFVPSPSGEGGASVRKRRVRGEPSRTTALARLSAIAGVVLLMMTVAAHFAITGIDLLDICLDVLSFYRTQLLILSVLSIAGVCLESKRLRRRIIFPAIAAAINAVEVLPWCGLTAGSQTLRADPAVPGKPGLVLCVANVLRENPEKAAFIRFVREISPDVLVVLEVNPEWIEGLQPLRAQYPGFIEQPDALTDYGLLILSRLPIIAGGTGDDGLNLPRCRRIAFRWEGRDVTLVAAHPFPPGDPARLWRLRNRSIHEIAAAVRSAGGPALVMGDLNMTMFSRHYKSLISEGGLANAREGIGLFHTFPSFLPNFMRIPLDHVLHSAHFVTRRLEKKSIPGSDHLGLVAELDWMESGAISRKGGGEYD